MTGFAEAGNAGAGYRWAWEMRGVNARGLDLRLRLPDWIGGLEPALRSRIAQRVKRGAVTVNLRVTQDVETGGVDLDPAALRATLAALRQIEAAAQDQGLHLAPSRAADVIARPGVVRAAAPDMDAATLREAILSDLPGLIEAFEEMRAAEGAALAGALHDQLGTIETLIGAAGAAAEARPDQVAATLRENLARVLEHTDAVDETRLAQELALIAVKSDIREELDRLEAHVLAARELLGQAGPVGRKLDFLMQEFNREANTLCAKAQSTTLTRIGLDLKATIDQMREQVQNVE